MNKEFNLEKLDEMFGLDKTTPEDISIIDTTEGDDLVPVNEVQTEEDNFIDDELRELIDTCKKMMDGAKYLISCNPDAESIAAAANLVSSLGTIMTEFNKAVLLHKKFNRMEKLETMKIKSREKLVRLRAELDKQKIAIGDNNTFVQNNLVSYNQEDIIKNIIAEEKGTIDN